MDEFERHRAHLRSVAYRILGSSAEADDAVQEAWLRLHRGGRDDVANLRGWLTTVVARVCLDMLRSRASRREEPLGDAPAVAVVAGPEDAAVLGETVGLALLVVLETLTPAERVAFVLHDLFAVPFDEIAPLLDRTPAATRQLASRARRRVQRASPGGGARDVARRRRVVEAFLAASRAGDFAALLALLDPDAVARSDAAAVAFGAPASVRGAAAVAETFAGRAKAARLATLGGEPGLVWWQGGEPRVAFAFTVEDSRIVAVDLIADADTLAALHPEPAR